MPQGAHSLLDRTGPPWGRYVVGSVLAHLVLFTAALIWAWAHYGEGRARVNLDQKPIRASLVRLGKKRDEHLLPRKEELPPPPKKTEAAEAPPEPSAKPPQKAAVALPIPDLKPPAAKSEKKPGEKEGLERKKALFSAFNKASKKSSEEEPEGSEDGDPNGDSAIQEGERYWGLLTVQVKRHYDIPSTISEDERISLKTVVRLRLARTGALVDVEVVKSSGNSLFDNAVLAAVKRAQPFSPPPDLLRDLLNKGVAMEFVP